MSTAAKLCVGPKPWQVVQRTEATHGEVVLSGTWDAQSGGIIEARVAHLEDGMTVRGCHWQQAAVDGEVWSLVMKVPTGGPYRLETRIRLPEGGAPAIESIDPFFVGDVWVIAGQSNAAGCGRTPHPDPPMLGVSLFHASGTWRLAAHPLFDPTHSKYPANLHAEFLGHSPWLAFAKGIKEKTGIPVGLIPAALGGSGLELWEPSLTGTAPLWDNMLRMVDDAGGRIAGVVWYQGETDAADEGKAESYLKRFQMFVERVRERYGSETPILTAQLNRVISLQFPWWGIVSEAQRRAAKELERVAVVPTVDLPLDDNIHTSSAGSVILGQRFAHTALEMLYAGERDSDGWRPADVVRAEFLPGQRTLIRLHFSHVVDALISVLDDIEGFVVEDEEGTVGIVRASLDGKDGVVIELARSASGRTLCHHAADTEATTTLRDGRGWPALAFHGVEVQG